MDNDLTTWKPTLINFNFVVVEQQKPTKIGIPQLLMETHLTFT